MVLIIFVILNFIPKKVNQTVEGIQFRLGNENINDHENVEIKVNGTLQKNIFGSMKFKGTIAIDGEILPPTYAEENELHLSFKENDGAYITFWVETATDIGWKNETFGEIFINNDLSELTITKFEKRENGSGWSGNDGLMISAPALIYLFIKLACYVIRQVNKRIPHLYI